MRAYGHAVVSVGLCLVAALATQGCGGSKNAFFGSTSSGNGATVSISFAGFVPVGAPEAFTAGNITAQNATTLSFLTGLIPAGRTSADIVALLRNDTNGSVTVIKPISVDPIKQTITINLNGAGTYQAEAPVSVDATHSTISISPQGSIPANGTALATILVTVRDASGNPLSGQTVLVAASGGNNTLTQPTGPSDLLGEASATLASTMAETKTITVTINAASTKPVVLATASVVFGTIGAPSATASSVTVSASGVAADGISTSQITIVVRDALGTALAGQNVGIAAVGTLAIVTQPAATDAAGETVATILSPYPGNKTIVVTAGGVTLAAQPTVTFVSSGRNVHVGTNVPAFSVYSADDAAGATGQLRPTVNQTPASGQTLAAIAVDTRGRFFFSAEGTQIFSRPFANQDGTGAFDPFATPVGNAMTAAAFEIAVTPSCRFAYAALLGTSDIVSYAVDPASGLVSALNPIQTTQVFGLPGFQTMNSNVCSIAMHPTGRFLYAVDYSTQGMFQPNVVAFAIDPVTGYLTRVGAPLDMGATAFAGYICCDPQGRYLVGVDQNFQDLYCYAINQATGELTELDELALDGEGAKPIVDGTGRFVYVPMLTGPHANSIEVFRVDASLLGAPGPVYSPRTSVVAFPVGGTLRNDLQTPAGPSLVAEPSGSFLTVLVPGNNELVTFAIDPVTGALSKAQAVRTQVGPACITGTIGSSPIRYVPQRLAVGDTATTNNLQAATLQAGSAAIGTPSAITADTTGAEPVTAVVQDARSEYVFSCNGANNTVAVATVDPASAAFFFTGTALPIGTQVTSLASGGASPYVIAFSVDTGAPSTNAGSLSILAQGQLQPNPEATTTAAATGGGVDPTGQWVYALEGSGVDVFSLNLGTGALGGPTNTAIVTGSTSVAFAPSGRFAYFANGNNLLCTSVDPGSGAIAAIASPLALTQAPVVAVVADPFGKFVYTLGSNGTVTGFSVDTIYQDPVGSEGALTQLGLATVIPGAVTPSGIAIDPSGSFLYVTDSAPTRNNVTGFTIVRVSGALVVSAVRVVGVGPDAVTVIGGPQ